MLSESFVLLSRLESKDKFAQLVARARARISINDINGHLYNEKNMGKIPRTNSALHIHGWIDNPKSFLIALTHNSSG